MPYTAELSINILYVCSQRKSYATMRGLLFDIEENTPFTQSKFSDSWTPYLEWVSNYESALQIIQHGRHDICLVEATLDGDRGLTFIQQASKLEGDVPCVLLAESPQYPPMAEALQAGAADYLLKANLSSPLLERSLRYIIERHQRQVLELAHSSLRRSAKKRTVRLRKSNRRLRNEIQERQQAEEKLRQSEEKYRTLVDNIQDGVFLVQNAKIKFANEAFARMLGYTVDEIIGKRFLSLIAPDDLQLIANQYGQVELKSNVPSEYEFRLRHRDQTTLVMVNINVGLLTYQNKPASIGTVKDITARKFVERELRKFSRAVHQSPVSILITDTQGRIEYVNPEFAASTGYTLEDVIGENPRVLKSGEHAAEYYEQLWATIASGGTWWGELHNKRKNGEFYWVQAAISPISNQAGETTQYLAILEDITERKRILAELRRHRQNLQEMVDERTGELIEANEKLQDEVKERTRLTEAIRQSRERLRLQYNGIPIPTYTWQRVGRDFVLIDFNEAASKAMERRIADFMGKKASEMFHDKPHILGDFKRCLMSRETVRREAPYQLLTTKETKFFITSYVFVPPNIVMVHMEDITRYKAIEQRFQECQERLQGLMGLRSNQVEAFNEQLQTEAESWVLKEEVVEQVPELLTFESTSEVGAWEWNIETGDMNFSQEWAEMLGYTTDEVKRNIRSWAGLMHLDDIAKVMDKLNTHFAGETPYYEAEHRLKMKSGAWKWILGRGKVVARDSNGRVLRMTGIHRDISERKQAEEALRRSHTWFQNMIETISDWVWEMDRHLVYSFVSPKVQEILGYKEEEVIGHSMFDFMPPDEAKRVLAVVTRRIRSRSPLIGIQSTNVHKSGHHVVLETNAMPYFDEDGLFSGYRGAHQDISNRAATNSKPE